MTKFPRRGVCRRATSLIGAKDPAYLEGTLYFLAENDRGYDFIAVEYITESNDETAEITEPETTSEPETTGEEIEIPEPPGG